MLRDKTAMENMIKVLFLRVNHIKTPKYGRLSPSLSLISIHYPRSTKTT